MNSKNDLEKTRKEAESMAHMFELGHQIVASVEKAFQETPEGRRAKHLHDIKETYLSDVGHFLHFVQNIGELIGWAKSEEGNSPKLAEKLERLADKVKHEKLPSREEIRALKSFSEKAESLQPSGFKDHEKQKNFHEDFHDILIGLKDYPGFKTLLGKIQDDDAIKNFENYKTEILLWEFVFAKLVKSRNKIEKLIPDYEAFVAEVKRLFPHAGIGIEKLDKLFEGKNEGDETLVRVMNLGDHIEEKDELGKWFLKLIREKCSDKERAKALEKLFMGGKRDFNTVMTIAAFANKMRKDIGEKEELVKKTLLKHLDDYRSSMEKHARKEMERFHKVVEDRIEELKKTHEENLAHAKELKGFAESTSKALAGEGEYTKDLLEEIKRIMENKREFYERLQKLRGWLYDIQQNKSKALEQKKNNLITTQQLLDYLDQLKEYEKRADIKSLIAGVKEQLEITKKRLRPLVKKAEKEAENMEGRVKKASEETAELYKDVKHPPQMRLEPPEDNSEISGRRAA